MVGPCTGELEFLIVGCEILLEVDCTKRRIVGMVLLDCYTGRRGHLLEFRLDTRVSPTRKDS